MNDRWPRMKLDDRQFDRLVDGELPPAEYQALLAALDEQPELWRRCALAFLEAQAWRSDMAAIRRGPEVKPTPPPPAAPRPRRWLPLLALAASIACAFCGGILAQRQLGPRGSLGPVAGAVAAPDERLLPPPSGSPTIARDEQEPQALGNIRLVVDGGQDRPEQPIDLPVYDLSEVGTQFLVPDEPALTPELVQQLERRGRKVQRHVEYLPLPLDDQRQIVVPVEQYEITPVSRRSY